MIFIVSRKWIPDSTKSFWNLEPRAGILLAVPKSKIAPRTNTLRDWCLSPWCSLLILWWIFFSGCNTISCFSHFADETSMCNQSKFDIAAILPVRGSRWCTLWQPFCVWQVGRQDCERQMGHLFVLSEGENMSFNDENKLSRTLSRA